MRPNFDFASPNDANIVPFQGDEIPEIEMAFVDYGSRVWYSGLQTDTAVLRTLDWAAHDAYPQRFDGTLVGIAPSLGQDLRDIGFYATREPNAVVRVFPTEQPSGVGGAADVEGFLRVGSETAYMATSMVLLDDLTSDQEPNVAHLPDPPHDVVVISQTPDDKPPFDQIPGVNPGVVVTIPVRDGEYPPLLEVIEFDQVTANYDPTNGTPPVSASFAVEGLQGPLGMSVLDLDPGQ